jgi:hypothetical protein
MKKTTLIFGVFFLLLHFRVDAQIPPNAFNYSAVARDAQNNPIANSTIGIQISILKGSSSGSVEYVENHSVNTDAFGLFNLSIGSGTPQGGAMATINWGNDSYFLKVGMDAAGGTNFLVMGTTQLLSVPYALYAKNAGGIGSLQVPNITTNAVTEIGSNHAKFSGVISGVNASYIIVKGIVLSQTPNPSVPNVSSTTLPAGGGSGAFDVNDYAYNDSTYQYAPLLPNTTYYVRAYATTENNITFYGNEVSFTTLGIGQIGTGGGIVFFDKGNNVGGWQYLEVATSDQSTGISWGCEVGPSINTGYGLGTGLTNTSLIVGTCNEVNFAAKLCYNLSLGGQTDWFLPSFKELELAAQQANNQVAQDLQASMYWTSTSSNFVVQATCFPANMPQMRSNLLHVRAIRAF